MKHSTEEQVKELETIFGIKRIQETAEVRDGVVSKGDNVWWRCKSGPEYVSAGIHLDNILEYPRFYQINKPLYCTDYCD